MEFPSLGRYQVRARLGRGTMGIVYRGYDPVLEREVALKTIDLSAALSDERRSAFLARFFQEAKIAAKLLHPNIVVTHDASTDPATGVPFIAMELVAGGSLLERMRRTGAMPWQEAAQLAVLLARALDFAHREGVVHRDVKPGNVLLTPEGVPKIADFGIAKVPDSNLTHSGTIIGTPYYMSPEQLESDQVDGRSDLFSLGSLFYAALVGHPPFVGADLAAVTRQILHRTPAPPSEVVSSIPPSLDGVVARTLAKDRGQRYATGAEMAEEIVRVLRGESPVRPLSPGERTVEAASKEPAARASKRGVFLALVAAGVLGYFGAVHWDRIEGFVRSHRERTERKRALVLRSSRLRDEARDRLSRGEREESSRRIEESLAVSREGGDGAGEAESLLLRGLLRGETGDWSAARADLDAAAAVFAIYDRPEGQARAVLELANLERDLGAFEKAERLYDQAGRERAVLSDVLLGRALLDWMRGDRASAERAYRAVLENPTNDAIRERAASALAALEKGESGFPQQGPGTRRSEERRKRFLAATVEP